jgi:hypothetical protein
VRLINYTMLCRIYYFQRWKNWDSEEVLTVRLESVRSDTWIHDFFTIPIIMLLCG